MVEINNQRKAFLDIQGGRRELIIWRQKTRNHGYDATRRRAIYWLLRSPRKLVTLNLKPNHCGAGRYQLFSCWWMPTASSLAWKTLSEKSDAVALQQIKERGALPMIDRGDIRQAIDRCSNIWVTCRALVMVSSSTRLTAWLQNSKKRGGMVREIDVMTESPRLSPLWLSASSSACHGLLIITVITPLPTARRDKNARELKLANAAITDMQMRQRDVAALDAKYTKELADAKAENDALRDDAAAGRRRLHIKAVCQSVREATMASGVDNAASPWLADTAERDYFTPRERLITMQNN